MKSGLLVLCLFLLPLTAQNNSEIKQMTLGSRMNGLVALPRVHLAAQSMLANSGVIYLQGSVEINLGAYTLLVDQADYNQDNGEIRTRGEVLVKPTPTLDPRGVDQFGVK